MQNRSKVLKERDSKKEGVFLPNLFGTTPSGLSSSSALSCVSKPPLPVLASLPRRAPGVPKGEVP